MVILITEINMLNVSDLPVQEINVQYFPFLVGDNFRPFVLLISPSPSTIPPTEWFKGSTMTYSLTRSDGTIRPGWIEFDQIVGRFEGKPSFADSSELI